MYVLFSLICILLLPQFIFTQEWVARYNGPDNKWDYARDIVVNNIGNVYVTGSSFDLNTDDDYATVKYDSSGTEQWVARYNGLGDAIDYANGIVIDDEGNVYVTGDSYGISSGADYATIKYDSLGVEQWVVRYNGPGNGYDMAYAISIDAEGNIYVTGTSQGSGTGYDYATVKYNSAGEEQWVARYFNVSTSEEIADAITLDDSGNVYITGYSEGYGSGYDYATVKYNSTGVEQWVLRYNGPGNDYDRAYSVVVDASYHVYVTGKSDGTVSDYDYATIRYNSTGGEQWVTRYNGPGNSEDQALAMVLDNASNIYITGKSYGSGTVSDIATVKYDSSGVEQWVVRYDGPVSSSDEANAIAINDGGNVCVTGYSGGSGTDLDYVTLIYNSSGVEQWVARYNGTGNGYDMARSIAIDAVGYVYVTGSSEGSGTDYDYVTIKYHPTGIEEYHTNQMVARDIESTVFQGPLQLPEGKKCKVFDITGRVVVPDKIQPGIYFIEVDGVMTQKVVKVR